MPEVAPPRPGRKLFKRYAVGIVLIIVAVCAATSVAAYNEVDTVVHAFQKGGTLRFGKDIAEAEPGKPQTILLIGSDKRAKGARDFGGVRDARSDTLILVRLDPANKRTAMLSIPRDLKVTIPGRGEAKINEAYSIGGAELTLKTIKQLTGLSINHVVNVDFGGFREAVNAVHCVYADIDRHYFNQNAPGADQYATINIQPGYQKLCGQDALDYVRYRHTDTDIVRAARQQDFIRQAKEQVGVGKILSDRHKLTKIFGDYTQSDLHARSSILRLLTLVGQSAKSPIVQIPFKGELGPSFVEASPAQMRTMVSHFLGPNKKAEKRAKKRRKKKPKGAVGGLQNALDMGRQEALAIDRRNAAAPAHLLPDDGLGGRSVRQPAARLRHPVPRQEVQLVPHGHLARRRPEGVLRPPGDDLEEPADPEGPGRAPEVRQARVRRLLRRRSCPADRLEDARRRLLDHEYPATEAFQGPNGADRTDNQGPRTLNSWLCHVSSDGVVG